MRRFLLVLLGGLLLNTYAFAQLVSSIQTGKATKEMRGGGLIAAHFNIPLGARVKISNAETGKEIEVTIRGRIPLSPNRIVDLSASAWDALGLTPDTEVRLVPPPSLANRAAPAAPEGYIEAPPHEAAIAGEYEDADLAVVAEWDEDFAEIAEWDGDEEQVDEYPQIADGDEEPEVQTPAVQPQVQPRQPRQPIKIIPGLPNPNSRKFYRLQVGAFSVLENAEEYERRAQALGFITEREKHGSLTRVLLEGIKASDVKLATEELEEAGFTEVWVREY